MIAVCININTLFSNSYSLTYKLADTSQSMYTQYTLTIQYVENKYI